MLYFRESGRDEKDVFELFDSVEKRVIGTLVMFYDSWYFDSYGHITNVMVHLIAEFVGDRKRDSKPEYPRRNSVTFLAFSEETVRRLKLELQAEKEDGCFVSVGGLVTDIEELEAQREGLPVWLL